MARVTSLLLLPLLFVLLTTSLSYVTSFALHKKRHSRSTDLGDALRMLERQRRRFGAEEGGLLPPSPGLLDDRSLPLDDLGPWFDPSEGPRPEEALDAAWLADTLGLNGYGRVEDDEDDDLPGEPLPFQRPLPPSPVQLQPTDQELDAIFGDKPGEESAKLGETPAEPSPSAAKKDKEEMTDMKGDVKEETVPAAQTRSADVVAVKTTSEGSDDVRLTKEEFKALLKAVEKLQKQAVDTAEEEMEEAGEVLAQVKDKVAEARQEAKEAEEEEEAAEEEEEAARQEEEEGEEGVLTPQPVSKEELDNLFEEQSQEVIPTDNGEIVKTEKMLKDSEGHPVGLQETVEEVESGGPDKATLNSIENFWYLKNYLDQDGDRKKRNSKRNYIPPSLSRDLSRPDVISPPDSAELIAAYVRKINELQSELDQTRLEAYLEDTENDILTDALNQATLAQVQGHINPDELASLQDAIQVEEALQKVKANRLRTDDLVDELADEAADDMEEEEQKRGEPWKKRSDVIQAEVPVFLTGDSDDVMEEEDDDVDDDSEEETTSVALGKWLDENQRKMNLNDLLEATAEDLAYLAQKAEEDVESDDKVASLFSNKAEQCRAVQEFSTNCDFAGDSIDYEARALCNVHEMCYACGQSLGVGQSQCDFIYRAASSILCRRDEDCVLEAEIFLNTMKLKHRFVPYSQRVCRSQCAAEFLSIV